MSRRSRRKRGKKKAGRAEAGHRLRVELDSVEFVAGHDGFLRGKPEPVIMVAAFGIQSERAVLLGRALRRLFVSGNYPSVTELVDKEERLLFTVPVPGICQRILLLALALEEDGGGDVSALYGAFSRPEAITGWSLGELMPEPLTLVEAGSGAPTEPPEASPVHLLSGGEYFNDRCGSDDWIGAAITVLETGQRAQSQWRFHFVSEDRRNDWTGVFQIKQ